MSTRYDELTEILGIGSVGTPSSTTAADDRKQTSRRDELYSMLGEITAQTPDTAETGASTTQRDASLETQAQGASAAGSQAATPQSAAPSTSSGAYAPPSPQGEGRSREQVQQELNDSQTRYKQLLLTAPYAANAQDSAEISKQLKAEQEKIQSLKSELEPLTAPSTNAERDSLIQRMNAITENEGYATTVEQADAVQQEKQDTRQRLHQLDQELGNAARFYDSGERAGAVTKGALKQVGASYEKLLSTTMGANNQLYERSPEIYKAVITNGQPWMLPEDYSPDAEKMREDYQRINDKAKALNESAAKDLAQAKEGLNALGQAGVDISTNLIQMGIDAAGRAAGFGMLPFFARAAGGSMLEAEQEGADSWGQLGYGLTKGAIEVGTEKLFDGLAGVFGKGAADDVIEGLIGKLSGSNTGRSLLRAFAGAAGEGTEEVISDLLDPFAKLIYNDQALKEAWENRAELRSQMLYDYLLGAAMGGLGSVTGAVTGQYAEKNAALGGMETQGAVVPPSVSVADSSPQGGASAASSQSAVPTAPLAEEPLQAATQGRPYSQPEQGNELNTPQEAQTQAAEAAQDAQRATPQAETPPTTVNAAQAASDELNTQAITAAREQGESAQREARLTEGADTVRGFSENVATDNAMEAALREDVAKNPDLYKRLSNKDTLKKAQEIFSQGLDAARSELERAIGAAQSGQKLSPEMVPLSRMVANELTRQGELTAARKIISDVAAELTGAGQLGQAAAILRNADPITVLNTLQKSIDAINAEVGKKFGKRNPWKAELTAEEIKQISEADFSQDGAFEAIQQQIAERLGREMPATVAEKLRELRKVGMLANPKTQLKNALGNAPLAAERKVAERLSGGLQELAVKAGIMSKEEQTRTLRVSQQSKDIAKSVYKNNIDRITKKGNKGELRGLLKDTRTYFNKGMLQKGIEKATGHQLNDAALDYVRRFTYDILERGDAPFVKSAFIDSLAQYCEAQGIKSEADVTETAFSYALDQAMAATFKDASALANLLNSIKDKAGIAGEALDVLLPFTTTPINIAKEFSKYSPLGYLYLLNTKGKGTAEVIDIISRATTGSAVVAIGAILRSLGFITGAADDDKDKAAADKAAGISPYSILGKYSYEWAQPTGSALAMGASIYDAAKDGNSLIETISNGIISAGDAYLEQSFFNDIIDLFQGYGSPSENLLTELLKSLVSQSVPSIVGAAARTIDPTVRTSYSGGNALDDALTALGIKTPGVSKGMAASVNVRGEEVQRGNLGERIWDNFITPWTTNRNGGKENAVDKALDEVYGATGDKTIFRQVSPYKVDYGGESYQMTGEEREQFQKTQGQVHDDILQQIIDGGQWKNLSNGEKVKIMQRVNEYALDSAKRELVEARGNKYTSDWDDEQALTDTGSYFVAKVKADKDGNGRISQEELWYYLGLQKNMPNSTKTELWDILTTGKTGYAQYAEKQK